jgi:glyoxylase-like metal-dependent hydrolase (beta-lactamase superfamily II)
MIVDSQQKNSISRGRFLRSAALLATGFVLAPRELFAQTSPVITIRNEAANALIRVKALRGNIHLLEGSGGNIAVFHGQEGKLMVDSGIAVSQKKIRDTLSGISQDPIKYLVNTHWHFDHVEGNQWLHKAGATIIAHKNTRINLSKTISVKDWNYTFSPSRKGALPTTIFSNEHTLIFNGSEIQMRYYPAAHTDSDISVYFSEADILQTGDIWWNNHYPFIDHSSGGRLDGMINAVNYLLKQSTNKTIIIPGHGAAGNKKQLQEFSNMLVAIKENVSKLKKAGRSLSETIAAKPTAAYDPKFGKFLVDGASFTRLVYADV